MGNAVANKWKYTLYSNRTQCENAIYQLRVEENKLIEKRDAMRKTNQEYETNVISHLSNALSQMDGEVKTRIKKASRLLAENYKGVTKGVREAKENLDESNNKITAARKQIEGLRTLVKAKQALINQRITNCNREIIEVRTERTRAARMRSILPTEFGL